MLLDSSRSAISVVSGPSEARKRSRRGRDDQHVGELLGERLVGHGHGPGQVVTDAVLVPPQRKAQHTLLGQPLLWPRAKNSRV